MAIMTKTQLSGAIRSIKTSRARLQDQIQETLISATFYAMKDGNVTPFNQLLDALGNSMHIKGVTMWAEVNAPVLVRDKAFTLNKTAAKALHVENEDDFAEYEADMRATAKWYEIAGPQKVESIFDPMNYLGKVADKLQKEGFEQLALEIRAAKGHFEMELIDAVEAVSMAPLQLAA
jgi:hypothetical protein